MAETSRFTGIGRLNTMRSFRACCRMKLLECSHESRHRLYNGQVVLPQNTRVRRQSCDCNADVVIYSEHFLLVRSQFSSRTLSGLINACVRNLARVCTPSAPTVWHVSLIASRLLQILASRLRAHTRLDGDALVARKQCYRSRRCF